MNGAGWHAGTVRVSRIVIGALFVLAGLSKLGDLRTFAEEIHNFRMVPLAAENLLAISLPWIELVAGVALIVGIRARAAALLVTGLLAVFTVAIAAALARGLDIECGCFGTADATKVGAVKILENLAMLVVGAIACARARPAPSGVPRASAESLSR